MSVIIPVYRDPTGIKRALDALLEQTYPASCHEVVVVDNGSDDGTLDVVEDFARRHPGRIIAERATDVQDSYVARNRGVEVSRGEILAFADADCVPSPDWLTEGVATIEGADASYAAGRVIMTFEGDEPNLWEYYDAVAKLNQRVYIEEYGFGATANLFVRRDAFAAVGRFREDLTSSGDYELGRRLANAGHKGVYAEGAAVRHPARRTARAVLKKERRIVTGKRRLARLGLLEHGGLTWRSFVPVRRWPELEGVTLSPLRRAALLLVFNFVRYYSAARWLVNG